MNQTPSSSKSPSASAINGSTVSGSAKSGGGDLVIDRYQKEQEEYARQLARDLGPGPVKLFDTEGVSEIGMNPGSRYIWYDGPEGPVESDYYVSSANVLAFLNRISSDRGEVLNANSPTIEAALPTPIFKGARIAGQVPPVVNNPAFSIRVPSTLLITLDEYEKQGAMSANQRSAVESAIKEMKNIFVIGGTGSGKTTLAQAILYKISQIFPHQRIVTIEDTPELNIHSWNTHQLFTSAARPGSNGFGLDDALMATLRLAPKRIIVGESRGPSILMLMDILLTGHPGGLSTFHAETVPKALNRMLGYCMRASNTEAHRTTIADAAQCLIVLNRLPSGKRVVTEMAFCRGLTDDGRYDLKFIN